MSVAKLLSRIIAPTNLGLGNIDESIHSSNKRTRDSVKSTLHDHTYGITSDPLTQFACVLSALFHDADHPGVPNAQLVKEKAYTARLYDNKSVAEQNSVDACWDLLMDVNFHALRKTICVSEEEQKRFRHLVVNSVMATDIVDKELKALRNARRDKAFSQNTGEESQHDRVNRKATIVIEHLIQASDIAHTMQHWHIYRKWNERLYQELLVAYRNGRSETDPSDGWYKGEIGLFDFYIIPLAKKLKDCGVFGVSCDEYLNYAKQNRANWVNKGQEIVAAMIEKYRGNAETPRKAQLDSIQDSDGGTLRSSLISSETDHGTSSHGIRAMQETLDLDTDAMSVGSMASFALSTAKSAKSFDGNKSYASSTETILEESDEWEDEGSKEIEKDDFYSESDSDCSRDSESDSTGEDYLSPKFAIPETIGGQSPANILVSTKSPRPHKNPKPPVISQVAVQNKAVATSRGESKLDVSRKDSRLLGNVTAAPKLAGINTQPTKPPVKRDMGKSLSGESKCSTTQAPTEWEQSTSAPFGEHDTMGGMEIYCLQQRINSRLVGSIKNSRAFDKKPSEDQMNFF